jgi:hypothetical protein
VFQNTFDSRLLHMALRFLDWDFQISHWLEGVAFWHNGAGIIPKKTNLLYFKMESYLFLNLKKFDDTHNTEIILVKNVRFWHFEAILLNDKKSENITEKIGIYCQNMSSFQLVMRKKNHVKYDCPSFYHCSFCAGREQFSLEGTENAWNCKAFYHITVTKCHSDHKTVTVTPGRTNILSVTNKWCYWFFTSHAVYDEI